MPGGETERIQNPRRMRTARGRSKRGSPLLGVSNRVGLGRGRNRNLPLPRVVSLWFFLFGQAKRKNIRLRAIAEAYRETQGRTARATARAKRSGGRPYGMNKIRACPRAAEGVGPYGLNEMRAYRRGVEDAVPYGLSGTFLIQFRIPNSEFRTALHGRQAKRKHSPVGLCSLVWMRTK